MPILTRAEFRGVRAAIDTSLTEDLLPDAQIELDIFQGLGERDLLVIVPDAEDIVETDPRVRAAATFFVAARLAPRIPAIVREQFGQQAYQRSERDMEKVAAALRSEAVAIANTINDTADPLEEAMPTFFTLASVPRRRAPYGPTSWRY